MHVGVCMDDAPDRKQLERLLGRSADRRLEQDPSIPYYVQSYGNKESLLRRPKLYDLIFIDLIHDECDSIELIRKLREMDVNATIVLCPHSVDLSGRLRDEDDVLVLRQPIRPEELEEILDRAVSDMEKREPGIDIRTSTETFRVKEEEFLYAEQVKDAIVVHLADGRELTCPESLANFSYKTVEFPHIFYLPDDLVANLSAVESTSFMGVILTDGKKFKVSRKHLKYMESFMK